MRIQPRREILDIWRSVVRSSFQDGTWVWGGRDEPNSISDAEQVLCLLYPATELSNLALEHPDGMLADVREALEGLGDPVTIPQRLVAVLVDYLDRYTDEQGEPIFAGGSYLRTAAYADGPDAAGSQQVTDAQRAIDVVDSYSMSTTLCLAVLGFVAVYRPVAGQGQVLLERLDRLEEGFRDRLTCAMIGLLRSFVVRTVPPDDPAYDVMLAAMNPSGADREVVLQRLRARLTRVRARLRDDVRIGVEDGRDLLRDETRLFECGWGWGIARSASPVSIFLDEPPRANQPRIGSFEGLADPRPYPYSTIVALYGIHDLRSARTRELGLLTEEQRRLNGALQLRADMTRRYWASIARLGEEYWPLEDIPWRTSDGEESDYYSLQVAAMVVQDMQIRDATDDDVNRMVKIVDSLAENGRITRRVTTSDPANRGTLNDSARTLHEPGTLMRLDGAEAAGPIVYLSTADFAPLLLKNTLDLVRLSANTSARDQLLRLAEASMDHLRRRRISYGTAAGLWDDPSEVLFPGQGRKPAERASWYLTMRVVEALISAARTFSDPPVRSSRLSSWALDLLQEADHLLIQQTLNAATDQVVLTSIENKLAEARQLVGRRPGTAAVLAADALRRLVTMSEAAEPTVRSYDDSLSSRPPGGLEATNELNLIQPYRSEPAGDQVIPVCIYLESAGHALEIERAILDVLHASGLVVVDAESPVLGSWLRVMSTRLKRRAHSGDILARLERALEIQALHRPQAEIDSAQADAVAKLITALSQERNAFIQIGSVFLIKVDGVTVVRNLTQQELAHLQRNSHILASPEKILQALEDLATGTNHLGPANTGTPDKILIEQQLTRVGVYRPNPSGVVTVTLEGKHGPLSSYDVDFGFHNGTTPASILLNQRDPTLAIKRTAAFPDQIEMTLDTGDGPIIYTLDFPSLSG